MTAAPNSAIITNFMERTMAFLIPLDPKYTPLRKPRRGEAFQSLHFGSPAASASTGADCAQQRYQREACQKQAHRAMQQSRRAPFEPIEQV
jgi:hypothetical protein